MSRCPYLEFVGGGNVFSSTENDYLCKLSGKSMDLYSEKVKYTCDCEYDAEYENCLYYRNHY